MNCLDAIYKVLVEAEQPLHYLEIKERILRLGLWESNGKTPEATINAQLNVDIKKHGAVSRFVRTGAGFFAINGARLDASLSVTTRKTSSNVSDTISKTLPFKKAAEEVLERFGNHRPMHYREITRKALELELIATEGQTPEATMYAQILTEIHKMNKRGKLPRFSKHGRGYVGLTKWLGKGLAFQIEQHNKDVSRKLHQRIRQMAPNEFEGLIGRLLTALGFESVIVTPSCGDGGIDVRGTLVVGDVICTKMAVQVKRWKNNVQAPIVQQMRGSLGVHEQGLIITISDFSRGAREEAICSGKIPIALMNGEQLVALLIENDIDISRTTHDIIELDEAEREE